MRVLCLALILFHIGVSSGMGHKKGPSLHMAMKPKQKGGPKAGGVVQYLVKPGTHLAAVAKFDFSAKLGHSRGSSSTIVQKCQQKINERFAHLASLKWGQSRFGEPLVNFKVKHFPPKVEHKAKGNATKHSHVDTILMVRPSHPASTNELYRYEFRCGVEESHARTVDWSDDYFFWRAPKDKHALTRVTEQELPEIWREIKVTMNNLTKGKEYPEYSPVHAVLRHNEVNVNGGSHTSTDTKGAGLSNKNILMISLGAGVPGLIIVVVLVSMAARRASGGSGVRYQGMKKYINGRKGGKNAKVPDLNEEDYENQDDDMWAPTHGNPTTVERHESQRSVQRNLISGNPYGPVVPVRPPSVPVPAPAVEDTYTDNEVVTYDEVPRETSRLTDNDSEFE